MARTAVEQKFLDTFKAYLSRLAPRLVSDLTKSEDALLASFKALIAEGAGK